MPSFPAHLFRRVTSGGAVLAELDGLRAVAILPVVLFHATLSIYLKGAADQVSAITGGAVTPLEAAWAGLTPAAAAAAAGAAGHTAQPPAHGWLNACLTAAAARAAWRWRWATTAPCVPC